MKHGEQWLDNPVEWGRQLIVSEDHDPLYSGLVRWQRGGGDADRLRRFLIAYWSCYSVGASWRISECEGLEFWRVLWHAANNSPGATPWDVLEVKVKDDRWPRAHERRHWRGQKCIDSVLWLKDAFPQPEDAVRELEGLPGQINLRAVELAVTRWPQFGPWIAFKAADMLERVLGVPVEFPTSITTMYRDPRKGAEMAGPFLRGMDPQEVTQHLLDEYEGLQAPPLRDRNVNVQEVETVLCKWKSARNGKYWIGCDTASHREELELWGGQELLEHYPSVPA